jgi:phospholipid N-methyltransferase
MEKEGIVMAKQLHRGMVGSVFMSVKYAKDFVEEYKKRYPKRKVRRYGKTVYKSSRFWHF